VAVALGLGTMIAGNASSSLVAKRLRKKKHLTYAQGACAVRRNDNDRLPTLLDYR
jgi:hypothetical protein